MITEQTIKEELSRAYTTAVSANAGMLYSKPSNDYGMDGYFDDVEYDATYKRYSWTGFRIDFQLKSTINAIKNKGRITYDLEVKNYRDLIKTNIGCPRILILYLLPRDKKLWFSHLKDENILRKCAWWCSLKGMPDVSNTEKVRISIPENQLLTTDELVRLMDLVKRGEEL